MNRTSRVTSQLSLILIILTMVCAPVVGRAATVATPTFSPAAGSYTGTQSVTLRDTTSGATIYYTTNGTTPSSSSTKYTGAISVSTSETIKAIAELSGDTNSAVASAAYTITVPTPTFSLAGGSYTGTQSVTLSDATSGTTIYYTTNGTTPTSSSTKYTGAIAVSASETIKAIAELSGATNSAVASAAYTITVPTPTFSLAGGSYTGTQSVTLSDATSGTTIYYTTNGTTPTSSSTKYTGAISVSTSETIKAIAELSGATNSAVASAAYTITVPTPTFSPGAGTYGGTQLVTISDATSGATCYYTLTAGTTGTTPTTSSTKYSSAVSVTATSVLEALCTFSGDTNSAVATAAYTFVAPTPTFSLVGGSYFGSQTVTISDTNSAATIYYTTNGTTPTTSSTKYTGAITVGSTETLEAMAVATGYSNSAVASVTYTITTTPGTLNIYLSPPAAQTTAVAGAATETFDALATGIHTANYVSTAGIGTYTGSSSQPFAITAANEYGGATDSTSSTPTNYFAVGTESGSENPVYLTLAQPVSYFGFWWSAGDAYNRVALYSGSSLYGTFSTADLLRFLNNGTGTINATNGSAYQTSAYFGNPNITTGSNDSAEPFAYVSFVVTGATITQIAFYNDSTSTGFESDNHSAIFSGNTVTIPTTFVPVETLTLGSQVVTPVFTPNYNVAPMTVTISTTTAGASINYTTDGSTPSATAGTLYSGPIPVTKTETIKAIGYETGMTNSSVASATYAIPTLTVASSSNPSTYGSSVTFTATISSGPTGAITFYDGGTSIGTGTISGGSATLTTSTLGVGAHSITASWLGNSTYGSVLSGAITQTVNLAAPTISFTVPNQTYGEAPFTVSATSNSSGAVTYSVVSGPATVSGSTVTITGVGAVVMQASQAASGNYAAGTQNASFTVAAEAPTITFTVPNQTYGVAPFTVSATSNSSGAITYSVVSGLATISGSTVTINGVGTVVMQASQAASGNYTAGTQNASFTVAAEAPTITFTVPNQTYGVAPFTVSATSNSSGAITYSVVSGPATVSGSTVTITGVGTVVMQASQAATTTYSDATASTNFSVAAATPTVTVTSTTGTYGTALTLTATSTYLNNGVATATGQTPSYTLVSGPATLSGGVLTFTGVGSVVVTAGVSATGNFAAATSPQTTITVIAAPSFTLAASPTSLSIVQGNSGTSTIAVSGANGFSGSVNLAASGLPSGVTAAFATNPTTGTSVLTLTVSSSATVGPATITITGTSDSLNFTTSIALTVTAPQCATNGYSYARAITIDPTRVPNTDQTNFPFLFSKTDTLFESVSNGGHVTSQNGYDIVFTSDPAGLNVLPFEQDSYNPSTGQVNYWIQTTLSHTADTVIYMWYGNSSIEASQAQPKVVWNNTYEGVWHLPNGTTLSTNDSTSNGYNGVNYGATAAVGKIGGAARFNGSSYIDVGNLGNLPAQGTIEFWMQPASLSSYPNALSTNYNGANNAIRFEENSDGDFSVAIGNGSFNGYSLTTGGLVPNTWYDIALTWNTASSSAVGYVNGAQVFITNSSNLWPATIQDMAIGSGYNTSRNWNGLIDEVRVSSTARSADWVATEYSNQSSPGTFYSLSPENQVIAPSAVTLYGGQSQQFTSTVLVSCNASVSWSMSPQSLGSLTPNGSYSALYAAPASIATQQTVTITATNTVSNDTASAVVTLMPPALNPTLLLTASTPSPYVTGSTETFVANLKNLDGTALSGIPVSFTVTGPNAGSGSGVTNSNGNALFTYKGTNSGTDTIQATATVGTAQVTSGMVPAIWLVPAQPISTSTVLGRFFLSPNDSADNDTPLSATPVFTQVFPNINFDPIPGVTLSNGTVIDDGTRPFTDVTTDEYGNPTGTIVAQGNGYQAGSDQMYEFQAVFTGTYAVAQAGNVTINFSSDDGMVLGIGGGATRVSGPMINPPNSGTTTFNNYPVIAAFAEETIPPFQGMVVVNFPAPGSYPYEIDYSECCGGALSLSMFGQNAGNGMAPAGYMALTPISPAPIAIGQSKSLTALVVDGSANPVPNATVSFTVAGPNQQELYATTDSTGQATAKYSGLNSGTDNIQAHAVINGFAAYSNGVDVSWTGTPLPVNPSPVTCGTLSVSASAPGTVILPNTLQLTGSASDSALPSGDTISYSWTELSGPGSGADFLTPQLANTTAQFNVAGSYVLQLAASDADCSTSAAVQIPITVDPAPGVSQGWIGSPANGSAVSGIVPITVAAGETLASGTLTYYPFNQSQRRYRSQQQRDRLRPDRRARYHHSAQRLVLDHAPGNRQQRQLSIQPLSRDRYRELQARTRYHHGD